MYISNGKALFEYNIIKEYTAGISLVGSEVKSIRNSAASISEAFIFVSNNEAFIKGMHVNKYEQSSVFNHDETRNRKLLLNKSEILHISKQLQTTGITCIPLELLSVNGKIKLRIAIARGKKLWDKKESLREEDIDLQTKRELNAIDYGY